MVCAGLLLASCERIDVSSNPPSSNPPSSEPSSEPASEPSSEPAQTSESSSIPTPQPVTLSTPVIGVNANKDGLVWTIDANASSYEVKVNDSKVIAEGALAFTETDGEYTVTVKAIGDGTNYLDSQVATYTYASATVALSDLAADGYNITFDATSYKLYAATSRTGTSFSDSDWSELEGDSFTLTQDGYVSIKAVGGYDEVEHVFYHGEDVIKSKLIVAHATIDALVFDTNTEVADDLLIKAYESDWGDAGNHAAVAIRKVDRLESEESVVFRLQEYLPYKIEKSLNPGSNSFDGVQLTVRGDDRSTISIQFGLGDLGYVNCSLGILSSNWHTIRVPFTDARWLYSGTSYTLSQVAATKGFTANDVGFFFDAARVIVQTTADGNYNYTEIAVKSFILVASCTAAADEIAPLPSGIYTGLLADETTVVKLDIAGKKFSTLNLETNMEAGMNFAINGDEVTGKTSADDGATLTYVGTLKKNGASIAFKSASGAMAAQVNGLNFNRVYTIEDFESYEATGVGLDQSHGEDARSGLRAAYLEEYYAGSGSAPLSGSNWMLMGSSDYLDLASTGGHENSKAGKFKIGGNAMRFTDWNLYKGNAVALPRGDTFSLWAKNPYDAVITLTVRLVPNATKVTGSDMGVEAYKHAISIPANSDWAQYTFSIKSTNFYAGYSLNFQRTGSVTAYPLIDDIQIYTAANPWAAPAAKPEPTKVADFEGLNSTVLQSVFKVDNVNSGQNAIANTDYVAAEDEISHEVYAKFSVASYAASASKQVIQQRFRFAMADSYGKFDSLKLRVKNNSSVDLQVGVWLCGTAGDSSTNRKQTKVDATVPKNSDWVTLDGLTNYDGDIYGFSLYVRNENIASEAAVNGDILVDDVYLYNAATPDTLTLVQNFDSLNATMMRAVFAVDRNSGSGIAAVADNTNYVDILAQDVLKNTAAKFTMTSSTLGENKQSIKYRFRFSQAEAFGKFDSMRLRIKNNSAFSLNVSVWICKAADSSGNRVQSGIGYTLPANSEWIDLTGLTKVADDIYGFSLYFYNENIAEAAQVTGSVLVDDVYLFNA